MTEKNGMKDCPHCGGRPILERRSCNNDWYMERIGFPQRVKKE
jgi:hypothetical protein